MREGIIRFLGLCKGFIRWESKQENDLPAGVSRTRLGIRIRHYFLFVSQWRAVAIRKNGRMGGWKAVNSAHNEPSQDVAASLEHFTANVPHIPKH